MNLKPGELVRYVGPKNPLVAPNCYGWVGKTVRSFDEGDGLEWVVDPPIPTIDNPSVPWVHVYETSLRKIDGGESPEESTEAMRLLTQLPQKEKVPSKHSTYSCNEQTNQSRIYGSCFEDCRNTCSK